jgi:hypothetical protein
VPVDNAHETEEKATRIKTAFSVLRTKLSEVRPDVLVIMGDDQKEAYDFTNFPKFGIFVGEDFAGPTLPPEGAGPEGHSQTPEEFQTAKGCPSLAISILCSLSESGFDPAFSMSLPRPERGMGHAFMRPLQSLTDFSIPTIPVLLNCFYAPQVSGRRAHEIGSAIGAAIREFPGDLRVAVIGSGGLWHTPMMPNAHIDEQFDLQGLEFLAKGNAAAWAQHFDAYEIPSGDSSQRIPEGPRSTGMPGSPGPQGPTRETCNWIAAASVEQDRPFTIVDYVPVYASPAGVAFAYST